MPMREMITRMPCVNGCPLRRGDTDVQNNLGLMQEEDQVVPQDDIEAVGGIAKRQIKGMPMHKPVLSLCTTIAKAYSQMTLRR